MFRPVTTKSIKPKGKNAAIFAAADQHGVDPYQLAVVVEEIWTTKYRSHRELRQALDVARKTTGLTLKQIEKWQNMGFDSSSSEGLDVLARELAGEFPILGLPDFKHDDPSVDVGALLFDMLANPTKALDQYGPKVLEDAAQTLACGDFDMTTIMWGLSYEGFAQYLQRNGRNWPRTETGRLKLDEETFRTMEKTVPDIAPLRQLLSTLGEMRLFTKLAIGKDGRNRSMLSQFASITGRNQPSSSKFIFGGRMMGRDLSLEQFAGRIRSISRSTSLGRESRLTTRSKPDCQRA